jgi:hypothetical protein
MALEQIHRVSSVNRFDFGILLLSICVFGKNYCEKISWLMPYAYWF